MPKLLHTVAAGTLAVLLSACQADPASPPAATSPAAQADAQAAGAPGTGTQDTAGMLATAGITCPQTSPGPDSTGCSAGLAANGEPYAVQLQDACNDEGFYAAVFQADGAEVVPQLPTPQGAVQADGMWLPDQQFVCIKAIARQGQSAAYYYVQAMDPAQVSACHHDATCDEYRPPVDAACTITTPQGCASGWVKADALEVFSNGIVAGMNHNSLRQAAAPAWQVLDTVRSGDGRFQLQVLTQPDDLQAPRSVRLQSVEADGRVHELARNDRLVPCAACGGVAGDPYAYSRFDDDGLEIVVGGGSRQRWSSHTRWLRPTHGQQWVLEWVQRKVVDTLTGQQRQQTLSASALGSPRLADFDPSTLPPAPVLP